MPVRIRPPARPLRGEVRVPGDKSLSHRLLLFNAVARGPARVEGLLASGDVAATLAAVRALGVPVRVEGEGRVRVEGRGFEGLKEPAAPLNGRRSGTTLRLLAGLLAGRPFFSVLDGDPQLRRRPMKRVTEPLRRMGAQIDGRDGGRFPPLAIRGGPLRGIRHRLPVASAQVKTALLLAGLQAEGETLVEEPAPSRDHSERLLAAMGAPLVREGLRVRIGPGPLAPLSMAVPGDPSSAAFLVAAAVLVPGSRLEIAGVGLNPTRMGFYRLLQRMGAEVTWEVEETRAGEPVGRIRAEASELEGIEVGGEEIPQAIDELPLLAVLVTRARGETVVRDAGELRVKETDRIGALVAELRRMGAAVEARPDGFVVAGPVELRGAVVSAHGDHRLAMALAVAALTARGETAVRGGNRAADSFPGFWETLRALGVEVEG